MSRFTDLLANPYAARRYVAILQPRDRTTGAVQTLYYSTDGFNSLLSDTPSRRHFPPRVKQFTFSRSLTTQGSIGGHSEPGSGTLKLTNPDGGLDFLADLAWGGTDMEIRMGGDGFALADFGTVFAGIADTISYDDGDVSVNAKDKQFLLDRPLQDQKFGGTGGWDGGADLAGVLQPFAVGQVRRVTPVWVDLVNLKLQLHSRAIDGGVEVTDQGVTLPLYADYATTALLDAAVIPGGKFATCLAECGRMRLGSPPAGEIRVSFRGDNVGGYVSTIGDCIQRIFTYALGFGGGDFVTASFTAANTANSAVVGYYAADGETRLDVLDQLAESGGFWFGFNRLGMLDIGRYELPAVSGAASFDTKSVLDFRREATAEPSWRLTLGYQKTWGTLSLNQLGGDYQYGGASAADAPLYTSEFRHVASAEDSSVLTPYPYAADDAIDTLLDDADAAAAEQTRLLALRTRPWDTFSFTAKVQPFALDLGDTITVSLPRYGLDGRNFVVQTMTEDTTINQVEMEVLG